jgi:hypothetical protein
VHAEVLGHCDELDLPVTLVVTVQKGVNDGELGAIVEHALTHRSVRGVTFQPVQEAGRLETFDPTRDRLTLSEVRRKLLAQTSVFRPQDVLPVPCHPDAIAMAYLLKVGDQVTPLSGEVPLEVLLGAARSTISFERDAALKQAVFALFSTGIHEGAAGASLKALLCCLPRVDAASAELGYHNLFRVIIMEFADARGFDVRSVKKSCVHIVHPEDGRSIPFDTYNLFYRDRLETERLAPLRLGKRALPLTGTAPAALSSSALSSSEPVSSSSAPSSSEPSSSALSSAESSSSASSSSALSTSELSSSALSSSEPVSPSSADTSEWSVSCTVESIGSVSQPEAP